MTTRLDDPKVPAPCRIRERGQSEAPAPASGQTTTTIQEEIAADERDAEVADVKAGYPPRRWRCVCGAEHDRGHFQALGVHRCMRCGYAGDGGTLLEPEPSPATPAARPGGGEDLEAWIYDVLRDDSLWQAHDDAIVKALHDAASVDSYYDADECREVYLPDTIPSRIGAVQEGARAIAARLRAREQKRLLDEMTALGQEAELAAAREARVQALVEASHEIRGRWEGVVCIVDPPCGNCGPCRWAAALDALGKKGA